MPGCAAVGCNNRSEKGFTMKCFPRNPKLRKIWTERVSRADWEPSNNSFLCHVHFEADQWTITQSGRIKLKKNAVPSIFTVTSTRKSPRKRRKLANGQEEDLYIIEYLDDPSNCRSSATFRNTIYNSYTTSNGSTTIDRAGYHRSLCRRRRRRRCRRRHQRTNIGMMEEAIVISDEESETSLRETTNRANGTGAQPRRVTCKTDGSEVRIKTEEKPRMDSDGDELDEIEAKLRSICDGEPQSDDKSAMDRRNTKINRRVDDPSGKDAARFDSGEEKFASKFRGTETKESQENSATDGKSGSRRTENSEGFRGVERNGRAGSRASEEKLSRKEAPNATRVSTFTIKLTGIDEDVTEIVEGLGTEPIFKYKSSNDSSRGNVVTSVISVTDGCAVKSENDGEAEEEKPAKKLKGPGSSGGIKKETSPTRVTNGRGYRDRLTKLSVESPEEDEDAMGRRELRRKIKFQEDVIRKLTGQLSVIREPRIIPTNHVNTRSQSRRQQKIAPKTCNGECRNSTKDQLLSELSLKIKDSNESIKRLNKSVNEEKQNVKNAQLQIRQRDNRIKELNWKLNKASKYIERAEKNANNYRKKMITLQNLLSKRNAELEGATRASRRVANSAEEERSVHPATGSSDLARMEICEDSKEPDASNGTGVVYRTVQDIFEESNHCDDDDPIIDNPEDFMRQFAGSL